MGCPDGGAGVAAADAGGGGGPLVPSAWTEDTEPSDDATLSLLHQAQVWQLQSSRLPPSPDPDHGLFSRVLRLERRLDVERKQLQRQFQRVERRMQDLLQSHMPSVGRWAELQGYVDGLAETVQGLLSSSTGGSPALPQRGLLAEDFSKVGDCRALVTRVDALTEELAGQGARLVEAEQGLTALVEAELDGRLLDLEAGIPPSRGTGLGAWAGAARGAVAEGIEDQLTFLRAEVTRLGDWAQDADCQMRNQDARKRVDHVGEQVMRLSQNEGAAKAVAEMREVREDLGQLSTQVGDLLNQLRGTEAGIQDGMASLTNRADNLEARMGDLHKRLALSEGDIKAESAALSKLASLQDEVSGLGRRIQDHTWEPTGLRDMQEAVRCLQTRLQEPLATGPSDDELQRLRRQLDLARDGVEDLQSVRQREAAKLLELDERLRLLREDHVQLSGKLQDTQESGQGLEACVAQHREVSEGRLLLLERQVASLLVCEEAPNPSMGREPMAQLGREPIAQEPLAGARLFPRTSSTRELSELRCAVEEMREQQAELAVGLGLRAQEAERSREALTCFQDLRGQVDRLGKQLPEMDLRVMEIRRSVDELAGEVQQLSTTTGSVPVLESRLGELRQGLTEAKELIGVGHKALVQDVDTAVSPADVLAQLEEQRRRFDDFSTQYLRDRLAAQELGERNPSKPTAPESLANTPGQQAQDLEGRLEDLQSQVLSLNRGQSKLEEGLQEMDERLQQTANLHGLPAQLDRLSGQHQEAEASLQEALGSVELLTLKMDESLQQTDSLRDLPAQLDRLSSQHQEAEASLQEARRSVEQLALKVQELALAQDPEPGASQLEGLGCTSALPESDTQDTPPAELELKQQLVQLRAEVLQLRAKVEEPDSRDVWEALSRLRGEHEQVAAHLHKVHELSQSTIEDREQRLQQEEVASDLGVRLREAERRLGEAMHGQLDRAWWQHAEELASGLSRAEERSLRQAAVIEELAGQLTTVQDQVTAVQLKLQELLPALAASQLVTEVRDSLGEVRTAQVELDTRLKAAATPEELRVRQEELQRMQGELAEWEAQRSNLCNRVERVERCLEVVAEPKPRQTWVPGRLGTCARRCPLRQQARTPPAQDLGQRDPARLGLGAHQLPSPRTALFPPSTPGDHHTSASQEPLLAGGSPDLAEAEPDPAPQRTGGAGSCCRERSPSTESHGRSSLETARQQARERLLSATLRIQPQAIGSPDSCLNTGGCSDVEQVSKELARHVRLEAHRYEVVSAVESRVCAMAERLGDTCARLDEAETGLEAAGRGGVALRLRFEQLQSLLDARLHALSAELGEVASRQLTTERCLADVASESARAKLEAQLRSLTHGGARAPELPDRPS